MGFQPLWIKYLKRKESGVEQNKRNYIKFVLSYMWKFNMGRVFNRFKLKRDLIQLTTGFILKEQLENRLSNRIETLNIIHII